MRFTHLITTVMALTILTIPLVATANIVKHQAVACLSEDLLDEIEGYIAKRDDDGIRQLDSSGKCTVLTVGEKVSVISLGFSTATIRYKGKKMYTASAAF